MRLAFIKDLFDGGLLKSIAVEPVSGDGEGWVVRVIKRGGESIFVTLANRPEQTKVYYRVNSALTDVWRIGFRNVQVILPEGFESGSGRSTVPDRS